MATRATDKPITPRPTEARRGDAVRRSASAGPCLDPRLEAELAAEPWEQSWELTPAIHTPVRDPGARQRWWTLERMLEPYARDAFALAPARDRAALDLHCGEGWIAQRLLRWGARRVVACDDREDRLRRARLLREHFAIPAAELDLRDGAGASAAESEGRFDVVVLAGAADRIAGEEPLISLAAAATRSICAIECHDAAANAVAEAALEAGFGSVERAAPPLHAAPRYLLGDLELLIAKAAIGR